jgi:Na+/H+ antiporter NhaD/arsenite permease-like protein
VLTAFSIFNLNVLPALGIQCWFNDFNYIDSMMTLTVVPLAVAALIFFMYLASSLRAKLGKQTEEQRKARAQFYSFLFLLLTFCVFIGCSSSVFLFLKVSFCCEYLQLY